jgi:hypothetical protein
MRWSSSSSIGVALSLPRRSHTRPVWQRRLRRRRRPKRDALATGTRWLGVHPRPCPLLGPDVSRLSRVRRPVAPSSASTLVLGQSSSDGSRSNTGQNQRRPVAQEQLRGMEKPGPRPRAARSVPPGGWCANGCKPFCDTSLRLRALRWYLDGDHRPSCGPRSRPTRRRPQIRSWSGGGRATVILPISIMTYRQSGGCGH